MGGTHPLAPALPSPLRAVWAEDGRHQFYLGSPHTLAHPLAGAGNPGLDPEDPVVSRGLQCARWEGKSLGVRRGVSISPRSLEIAPGVGSSPAPPGSQMLPKPPGLSNGGGHIALCLQPRGQARRSPSGRALLEELNIEQGDTVARQKQAVL